METNFKINFRIGRNTIHLLKHLIRPKSKVFIVTDTNVYARAIESIVPALPKENRYWIITVEPGEQSKNFGVAYQVIEAIIALKPERNSTIIAFGGGVITDLAGFVSSIILRGIPLINVPSSLLAQVDSGIGGKTAINSEAGKNLIGSIYNPVCTIIDTRLLETLPEREWRSGYAEIVKYALIRDEEFFWWLDRNLSRFMNREPEIVTEAILRGCNIKKELVETDFFDTKGKRALLNFGHTLGHAIEAHNQYQHLTHGEAISIGMIFAMYISDIDPAIRDIIVAHFKAATLPTEPLLLQPYWNKGLILENIIMDKKCVDDGVNFICLKGIGAAQRNWISIDTLGRYLDCFFTELTTKTQMC